MGELVPFILGLLFGAGVWRKTSGRARVAANVIAVIGAALTATVVSGEFRESWLFLLLDAGLAAFGLTVGFLLVHAYPHLMGKPGLARDSMHDRG
jgi:hypothetical protein